MFYIDNNKFSHEKILTQNQFFQKMCLWTGAVAKYMGRPLDLLDFKMTRSSASRASTTLLSRGTDVFTRLVRHGLEAYAIWRNNLGLLPKTL